MVTRARVPGTTSTISRTNLGETPGHIAQMAYELECCQHSDVVDWEAHLGSSGGRTFSSRLKIFRLFGRNVNQQSGDHSLPLVGLDDPFPTTWRFGLCSGSFRIMATLTIAHLPLRLHLHLHHHFSLSPFFGSLPALQYLRKINELHV
jgi:hypothetical protein